MANDPIAYALYEKPPSPEIAALLDEMARKARAAKKPRRAKRKAACKTPTPAPGYDPDLAQRILDKVWEGRPCETSAPAA